MKPDPLVECLMRSTHEVMKIAKERIRAKPISHWLKYTLEVTPGTDPISDEDVFRMLGLAYVLLEMNEDYERRQQRSRHENSN
jgi:hypothetical protein